MKYENLEFAVCAFFSRKSRVIELNDRINFDIQRGGEILPEHPAEFIGKRAAVSLTLYQSLDSDSSIFNSVSAAYVAG
ncbi:MAG TPA: hypothetical protein VJ417_15295 [Candidatus Glassbacteria bacterium]|nr:hypothetical protein [Candidatus Glassbacteria bacterium]